MPVPFPRIAFAPMELRAPTCRAVHLSKECPVSGPAEDTDYDHFDEFSVLVHHRRGALCQQEKISCPGCGTITTAQTKVAEREALAPCLSICVPLLHLHLRPVHATVSLCSRSRLTVDVSCKIFAARAMTLATPWTPSAGAHARHKAGTGLKNAADLRLRPGTCEAISQPLCVGQCMTGTMQLSSASYPLRRCRSRTPSPLFLPLSAPRTGLLRPPRRHSDEKDIRPRLALPLHMPPLGVLPATHPIALARDRIHASPHIDSPPGLEILQFLRRIHIRHIGPCISGSCSPPSTHRIIGIRLVMTFVLHCNDVVPHARVRTDFRARAPLTRDCDRTGLKDDGAPDLEYNVDPLTLGSPVVGWDSTTLLVDHHGRNDVDENDHRRRLLTASAAAGRRSDGHTAWIEDRRPPAIGCACTTARALCSCRCRAVVRHAHRMVDASECCGFCGRPRLPSRGHSTGPSAPYLRWRLCRAETTPLSRTTTHRFVGGVGRMGDGGGDSVTLLVGYP
ncbi:hypothetical protein C8R46DRAFT_1308066 [Mycena filopes]|nr:hypothetical protein C8R46DRAFT_1308066 [Mycena filopes]